MRGQPRRAHPRPLPKRDESQPELAAELMRWLCNHNFEYALPEYQCRKCTGAKLERQRQLRLAE
jgi:hypothetical protein